MTVEFFLVLPMVLLVVFASIQVISVARVRIELQGAARDGARVAATTPDPSKAVEAVLASVSPELREAVRVSVERPGRVGVPAVVSVSLRYQVGRPLLSTVSVDLSARATMRTER